MILTCKMMNFIKPNTFQLTSEFSLIKFIVCVIFKSRCKMNVQQEMTSSINLHTIILLTTESVRMK